jgi:hypothetical protein
LADRHAAYGQRRDGEVAERLEQLDKDHPAVKPRLATISQAQRQADEQAAKQDYVAAQAALDLVLQRISEAHELKTKAEDFKSQLALLEPVIDGLTTSSPRRNDPQVGAELVKTDQALALAKAKAQVFDLEAADKALDQARAQCQAVQVKKLMKSPTPDMNVLKAQMQTLNRQPGGPELIDALVKGMGPGDPPEQVLTALTVRFNLKAGAEDQGGPGAKSSVEVLQRIYKLMAEVPAKHTKENPRMKQVTRKPAGGSSYGGGTVVLGDALNEGSKRQLVLATELPDVEDRCKPPTGATPPVFFDWNVQHEIAHALDDKKKFMSSRENDPAYGGWINHGGNVSAVAKAAADALALEDIDASMIALYLDSGTVPSPEPDGWDTVTTWADATRHGQIPWKAGALCKKAIDAGGLIIGDRIYHEAYANRWVSYQATARAQGITGYQFRAPGEWFSELYAAYKSGQMKPAHPARVWLNDLFAN